MKQLHKAKNTYKKHLTQSHIVTQLTFNDLYYMSDTVLGATDTLVNKTEKISAILEELYNL